MTLPTILTTAGLQPQSPASLLAQLIALVLQTNPGYTATLPASLIEDVSSTDVGGVTLIDQARVETVNSLTPYGANAFILSQLGQMLGVEIGVASNTSVFVVFTGPPGFVIAQGFTVSDGTNQYVLQDGGVIGSGGTSLPLFAVATQPGSFVVPAGTVTNLVTSVPNTIVLSVVNPEAGTPGNPDGETEESYRSRVLQAYLAASQGMARYLKTLLGQVPGVQTQLISVRTQATGEWEVIVGGGDPYQVAYAIYTALFDISTLVGSELLVEGITNASAMVVTTTLNHGFVTGQITSLSGVTPGAFDYSNEAVTVLTEKTFSVAVDSTGFGSYTSGGIVTPNLRNIAVSLNDYPDTYVINYVNPPQQVVTMTVTWNTDSPNFVSSAAVAQLANPALVAYINGIPVGQPINLLQMNAAFGAAIASVLQPQLLTRLVFSVAINGSGVSPISGTEIIVGDPESYFFTTSADVTIVQG